MAPWNYDRLWYHGSPLRLESLRPDSMVTPFEQVAKAFSHKPSLLSFDEQDVGQVKHDGQVPGFLYVVACRVTAEDLELLSDTGDTHWQVQRELPLKLLGNVPVDEPPQLTAAEIAWMRREHPQVNTGSGFIGGAEQDA